MTLTPNHFSVESGFQGGVVVELNGICHYFCGVEKDALALSRTSALLGNILYNFTAIKTIAVLTGPMRFWAADVPQDATICLQWTLEKDINWLSQDSFEKMLVVIEDEYGDQPVPEYTMTRRPWWCDFGKAEK